MTQQDTKSQADTKSRIEIKSKVKAYLQKMKYALKDTHTKFKFQQFRLSDKNKEEQYTNNFTVHDLFPNSNPESALKRELKTLDLKNYQETVQDTKYPALPEMRVFGKTYKGKDVYIKVRVQHLSSDTEPKHFVFVMSFHYAEYKFSDGDFPYKKE